MATIRIGYAEGSCFTCQDGQEVEIGQDILFYLDVSRFTTIPSNPISGVIIQLTSADENNADESGFSKVYVAEFDDADLPEGITSIKTCDLDLSRIPECKTCASNCELEERLAMVEGLVDTNTLYTNDGSSGLLVSSDASSNIDLSHLFDDTDTSISTGSYSPDTNNILTLPTEDENGVITGNVIIDLSAYEAEEEIYISLGQINSVTNTWDLVDNLGNIVSSEPLSNYDSTTSILTLSNGDIVDLSDNGSFSVVDVNGIATVAHSSSSGANGGGVIDHTANNNPYDSSGNNLTGGSSGEAIDELASFTETTVTDHQGRTTPNTRDLNVTSKSNNWYGYNASTINNANPNVGYSVDLVQNDESIDAVMHIRKDTHGVIHFDPDNSAASDTRSWTSGGATYSESKYSSMLPWRTAAFLDVIEDGDTVLVYPSNNNNVILIEDKLDNMTVTFLGMGRGSQISLINNNIANPMSNIRVFVKNLTHLGSDLFRYHENCQIHFDSCVTNSRFYFRGGVDSVARFTNCIGISEFSNISIAECDNCHVFVNDCQFIDESGIERASEASGVFRIFALNTNCSYNINGGVYKSNVNSVFNVNAGGSDCDVIIRGEPTLYANAINEDNFVGYRFYIHGSVIMNSPMTFNNAILMEGSVPPVTLFPHEPLIQI